MLEAIDPTLYLLGGPAVTGAGAALVYWRLRALEKWLEKHVEAHEKIEEHLGEQGKNLAVLNDRARSGTNGYGISRSDVQHEVNDALQGHVLQDHERH